jgi:hypothetical protein
MTDPPVAPAGTSRSRENWSKDEIIALAREDMEASRELSRRNGEMNGEQPAQGGQKRVLNLTVDLGHKGLTSLPEEVIDIIKDEIERSVFIFGSRCEISKPEFGQKKRRAELTVNIGWRLLIMRCRLFQHGSQNANDYDI